MLDFVNVSCCWFVFTFYTIPFRLRSKLLSSVLRWLWNHRVVFTQVLLSFWIFDHCIRPWWLLTICATALVWERYHNKVAIYFKLLYSIIIDIVFDICLFFVHIVFIFCVTHFSANVAIQSRFGVSTMDHLRGVIEQNKDLIWISYVDWKTILV